MNDTGTKTLPRTGCNVYYGQYVDNYNNGVRTRYYKAGNKWIESTKQSATQPTGIQCMEKIELVEGSEISGVVSIGGACLGIIMVLLGIKMVLGKLLR